MIRLILAIFLLQITNHLCQAETYGDSSVHAGKLLNFIFVKFYEVHHF